jgi:predicted nucleotidyltransferase
MTTPTLATIDEALIDKVLDRILSTCSPERVILFGSAAQKMTNSGSDLDLLVVTDLPEGTSSRDMARRLHALFEGWRLPLDLIVLTPEAFDRGVQLPGHIAAVAARDGERLYG